MTISRFFVRHLARAVAVAAVGGLHAVALGGGCPCGTVADEFRAADAGLVREWIVPAPFDSAGWRLERVVVGDGLVVAQSGDGSIHAIRSAASPGTATRAGTVAWSRTIDAAAGQSWPVTIGPQLVLVASESAVHAVDRDTGHVVWERSTDGLTAGSAVQSGGWVYTPLQTDRVLRLPVNPLGRPPAEPPPAPPPAAGRRAAKPAAPPLPAEPLDPVSIDAGGSIEAAPLPLNAGVVWATSTGLVALERSQFGWTRHQLPESSPPTWVRQPAVALAGPPVVRGDSVFIATAAGGLARVDLNAANRPGLRTAWAAAAHDRVTAGPLVSDDVVLVALGPAGLAAFSAADGRELWRTDLVGTPVALAGGRAWVVDELGRLTAIDLATGSRRQSLCLGCFTLPVVNPLSDRIVLASPGGLIVSLALPAALPRPVTDAARPDAAPAPADPAATPP